MNIEYTKILAGKNDIITKAHLFDFLKHSNEIPSDKFLQVSLRPATGAKQFGQQVGVTGHVLQAEGCAGNTSAVSSQRHFAENCN